MLELYIGNKCFSSWSLRPWLALKHHGIPFTEKFVRLRQPDTPQRLLEVSPSGRVPVLHHDGRVVWDTLAILEYLDELFPDKLLWPADTTARALARSVSAEMHSGFVEVRNQWGMNLRRQKAHKPLTEAGQKQANRIEQVWRDCRTRFGKNGPFLFGRFTAADAMYAPVVTRFDTYGGKLGPDTRAYVDAVLTLPDMKEWYAGAAAEPWPEPSPDD
jgi:glutathione S-transferase